MLHRDFISGNLEHRCPEALEVLRRFRDGMTSEAEINLTGQAAFEAGVLFWNMITRSHPLPGYPMAQETGPAASRRLAYTAANIGVLSADMQTKLARAGYPAAVLSLIKSMVSFRAEDRPSLQQFAFQLDCLMHPTLVRQLVC